MEANASRGRGRAGQILSVAVSILGAGAALAMAFYFADALLSGEKTALIGLVGVTAVATAAIANQRFGMWLWLALTPFAAILNISMGRGIPDLGLYRMAILSLLVLLIGQVAIGQRRLARPGAIEIAATLYAAGVVLSAGNLGGYQGLIDFLVLPLLVYYIARNLQAGHGDDVGGLLVALGSVGVILGLVTIREQLTGQAFLSPHSYQWVYTAGTRKVTSIFGQPATMAMALSMIAPALFYAVSRARTVGQRLAWGIALAITLLGVFMTYVRGGWLAVVAGLAVMLVMSHRARRYLLPVLVVAVIAVVVFGSGMINQRALVSRFSSDASIAYRLTAWSVSWQIFKMSPLIGIGFGNFEQEAIDLGWVPRLRVGGATAAAPHNMYLHMLTGAGLVGTLPFLALLGLIVARGIRLWRGRDGPGPVYRDLLAWLFGTLLGYILISGTFDALGAQLGNVVAFLVIGTVFGAHEPDLRRTAS
jgi:O-antigen ligase